MKIRLAVFTSSLIVFFLQLAPIVSAQNDSWPYCDPFDVAYPVGCKKSPFDICASQSEECRNFLCENKPIIDDAIKACQGACGKITDPEYVTAGDANEYRCWCFEDAEPSCVTPNNAELSHYWNRIESLQQRTMLSNYWRGGANNMIRWGGTVELPSETLLPVYCNQKTKCIPSLRKTCNPCPADPTMCKVNDRCYKIAEYNGYPETACGEYRAAAFELRMEWYKFFQLIDESPFLRKVRVATAGVAWPNGPKKVTWNRWDIPYTGLVLPCSPGIRPGVLYFNVLQRSLYEYGTQPQESASLKYIACQLGGREGCRDCVKVDQYGNEWSCCNGVRCERICPMNAVGDAAYWTCNGYQYSTQWPIYNRCYSFWYDSLTKSIYSHNTSSFAGITILNLCITDESIFGHEILKSIELTSVSLNNFLDEISAVDEPSVNLSLLKLFSDYALGVIDKFFVLTIPWEQLREDQVISRGSEIQDLANTYGFAFTNLSKFYNDVDNMTCLKEHFMMEAQFLKHTHDDNIGDIVQFPMQGDSKLTSTIAIRKIPFQLDRNETINLEAVGQIIPIEFAEKLFPARLNSLNDSKKRMNSDLIQLTLHGPNGSMINELGAEDAVLITFKHIRPSKGPSYETIWHKLYPGEKPTAIQGTERCVHWDRISQKWVSGGCRILRTSNRDFTECVCNHLAPFSLFSDVHQYQAKDLIIEIISIVFSSLSVISLFLTLLALYIIGGQEERNKIDMHLCSCLLTGHGMALTVLDKSFFHLTDEVCELAAVCLHYAFLSAFMWMAVEGHYLYRMVVRVFDSGRDFSKIYLCLGYGAPLCCVGITFTITSILKDQGYANDELCWLSTPNYIWAFMGPVVILTGINLVVLVLSMKEAVAASAKQMQSLSSCIKVWVKGWFTLSSLLGVTWIFGFFYIAYDHNFAYAFVTLNGLQGVIMFLTRIVLNEQVKTALRSKATKVLTMRNLLRTLKARSEDVEPVHSSSPDESTPPSVLRFGDSISRCRSNSKQSISNSSGSSSKNNPNTIKRAVNPFRPASTASKDSSQMIIKRKIKNSWSYLRETLLKTSNIEIQADDISFKDMEKENEINI